MPDIPTQLRNDNQDRTAYLKDFLKYPVTKDDLPVVTREMARLLISLEADIATLPELRNMIAKMNRVLIDFMGDQLKYREDRQTEELRQAEEKAAKAREDLNRTSQKIKAIKMDGTTGVPTVAAPPAAMWSRQWWNEKIVTPALSNLFNIAVAGVIGFILLAVWLTFKTYVLK